MAPRQSPAIPSPRPGWQHKRTSRKAMTNESNITNNLGSMAPGFFRGRLRTVNEVSVCDMSRVTCRKGGGTRRERHRPSACV